MTEDEYQAGIDELPDHDPARPANGYSGRAKFWTVYGGQTVRVRMLNVSNGGYLMLRWPHACGA